MPRIDDPFWVREQYESEGTLAARASAYVTAEGDDPRQIAWDAIAELKPVRVLEVGGGEGDFAGRIVRELHAEVVAIDHSRRMVEIQRSKEIDARIGDVRRLPFRNDEFDVGLAAWMLYHVPDVDRALGELARVLRSGGRLVAVTNGVDHLAELWDLVGRDRSYRRELFGRENGEAMLSKHFARVERRDADGRLTLDDVAIRRYIKSVDAALEPPSLGEPLRVRRATSVFVAEKA